MQSLAACRPCARSAVWRAKLHGTALVCFVHNTHCARHAAHEDEHMPLLLLLLLLLLLVYLRMQARQRKHMLIAALVGCIILALALGLGLGLGLQPAKKSELAHHDALPLLMISVLRHQ